MSYISTTMGMYVCTCVIKATKIMQTFHFQFSTLGFESKPQFLSPTHSLTHSYNPFQAIEGVAGTFTPEECAQTLIDGIGKGYYEMTNDLGANLARIVSRSFLASIKCTCVRVCVCVCAVIFGFFEGFLKSKNWNMSCGILFFTKIIPPSML